MSEKDKEKQAENQSIVEEKITKVNGEVQIRKYIKGRLLGKGGFAKCYEFINHGAANAYVTAWQTGKTGGRTGAVS